MNIATLNLAQSQTAETTNSPGPAQKAEFHGKLDDAVSRSQPPPDQACAPPGAKPQSVDGDANPNEPNAQSSTQDPADEADPDLKVTTNVQDEAVLLSLVGGLLATSVAVPTAQAMPSQVAPTPVQTSTGVSPLATSSNAPKPETGNLVVQQPDGSPVPTIQAQRSPEQAASDQVSDALIASTPKLESGLEIESDQVVALKPVEIKAQPAPAKTETFAAKPAIEAEQVAVQSPLVSQAVKSIERPKADPAAGASAVEASGAETAAETPQTVALASSQNADNSPPDRKTAASPKQDNQTPVVTQSKASSAKLEPIAAAVKQLEPAKDPEKAKDQEPVLEAPNAVQSPDSTPRPVQQAQAAPADKQPLKTEDRQAVLKQVVDRIETLVATRRTGSVTIRLQPNDLGTIQLTVRTFGNRVDADIVASRSSVQLALEQHRNSLGEAIESKGLTLGNMNVAHQGDQSKGDPRSQSQTAEDRQRLSNVSTFIRPSLPVLATPLPWAPNATVNYLI